MLHYWNSFIKEGDILFDYMINNFKTMFNNNNIKHFNIRDGIYGFIYDVDEIYNKYKNDIEKELIEWIYNELNENRLYNNILWKPFRDQQCLSHMYYGYRHLFTYNQYIFQLTIEKYCELSECIYCNNNKEKIFYNYNNNSKHFSLASYGINENNIVQPYDRKIVDIIPDYEWKYK